MSDRRERVASRWPAIPVSTGAGIALALGAALISGVAIFLNSFAVKQLPDPAVYTTLKNVVAAIVLVTAVLVGGGARDVVRVGRRGRLGLLVVGIIGGGIPFILFFTGLAQASAPSAAFIQKTLFVWVALLAVPLLGERIGIASIAALIVLLIGQALVLPPNGLRWGGGETLILAATLFWAVETVIVRRLLGSIPTHVVASSRMVVGLVVLVGYLAITGKLGVIAGLSGAQWGWVLLTGLILAAYVGTWFAALRRAPASVITSVLVLGAVVTGFLSAINKGSAPDPTVVGGYVLIVVAAGVVAAWSVRSARSIQRGGLSPARS